MIVTQARHTWTLMRRRPISISGKFKYFKGWLQSTDLNFLRDRLLGQGKGGFIWLVDKQGTSKMTSTKTAYGNAFGIFWLAAYYEQSGDPEG